MRIGDACLNVRVYICIVRTSKQNKKIGFYVVYRYISIDLIKVLLQNYNLKQMNIRVLF